MNTKSETKIMAAPIQYLGRAARDMKYLYNWSAPIIKSQHEPDTFYHCAQLVLRTTDKGLNWEEISPDLTRNMDDKQGKGGGPYTNEAVGAENYGTIAHIMESPHEKGVLWTGSDDGLVHLTRNGGETWENVTPKGLNECLVNAIEVSPHDPATAYIATTRYKFNDYTPALYKTTDYGKSWTNISAGIPYGSFTRVVREDVSRKNLLYAGTEKGVFISWNGGTSWESLQLNLPVTPITDLKVHQGDLIIATSGRSFWILDDLNALGQYKTQNGDLKITEPEDAYNGLWYSPLNSNSETFKGTDPFNGVNPANGVVLFYELPIIADSTEISLVILDEKGKIIRELSSEKDPNYKKHNGGGPPPAPLLPKEAGLNRFVWDMHYPIMPGIPGTYMEADFRGHKAPPGIYTFQLKLGDKTVSTKAKILETPGFETQPGQYAAYDEFMTEMEQNLTEMHQMVNTLYSAQMQLKSILKDQEDSILKKEGMVLFNKLNKWDEDMIQRKSQAYDDVENFPNKFTAEYLFLINESNSTIPRVNTSSRTRKNELDKEWSQLKAQGDELLNELLPEFNQKLWAAGIGAIRTKK
jgi:hypothetical protein